MNPSTIFIIQVWGISILNMIHQLISLPHFTPHLICHSLMMLIDHLPHSQLVIKEGYFSCQILERIHYEITQQNKEKNQK